MVDFARESAMIEMHFILLSLFWRSRVGAWIEIDLYRKTLRGQPGRFSCFHAQILRVKMRMRVGPIAFVC